jgi:uncharacterized protein YdaU (DUF1376 family)
MSAKSDIWMPIYIGDLLADTQHLTNEQFGIYHKLFYHQWRHGHFSEDEMATIAGFSNAVFESASSTSQAELKQAFSRVLAALKQMLAKDTDGLWFSRRCDLEKVKWFEKKRVFTERARKGGLAKARRKREEMVASSSASSVLEGMLEPCTSPSQVEEQKQKLPPPTPSASAAGDEANQADAPSTTESWPPAIAGEVLEAGRELVAGIVRGVQESINKAKTPKKPAVARPNGAEDVEAHQGRENLMAAHGRPAARHLKNAPDPPNIDPRLGWTKSEVLAYWAGQNPDGPELHYNQAADRAFRDLLRDHPELTHSLFKKLLHNRRDSEVNPSALPHRWLRNIFDYLSGPLDKFGKPLRKVGKL